MSNFAPRSMKRKNVKGLALDSQPAPASAPSFRDNSLPGSAVETKSKEDTLEIGVELKLDLNAEDLLVIKELGAGNGGSVSKVQHKATKVVMARKIIHVEAKPEIRKRIVRELGIMHECNSPFIVSFYGAFMNPSGDVVMCMEYADVGSLDAISKNFGPIRIDVLGKIAEAILGGLTYLYSAHRIMHRDIKPSNVLVNSKGNIKLCDFGVSSELENSVADTFVGTGTYMAPERIQGSPYTVKSDVWSVGLTLMELAIGKFPFASEDDAGEDDEDGGPGPQSILDLLQQIVMEPSPKLPKSDAFPQILDDMIARCLLKDPQNRPTPRELYEQDSFIAAAKRTPVDLQSWAVSLMERHNRKSHLPPTHQLNQAYPSTSPGPGNPYTYTQYSPTSKSSRSSNPSASATPTIQDLPIANLTLQDRDDCDYDRDPYDRPSNAYSSHPTSAISASRPSFPGRTPSSNRINTSMSSSTSRQQQLDYGNDDYYTSTPIARPPSQNQSGYDRNERRQPQQSYSSRMMPPPQAPLPMQPSRRQNGTPESASRSEPPGGGFRAYPPGY